MFLKLLAFSCQRWRRKVKLNLHTFVVRLHCKRHPWKKKNWMRALSLKVTLNCRRKVGHQRAKILSSIGELQLEGGCFTTLPEFCLPLTARRSRIVLATAELFPLMLGRTKDGNKPRFNQWALSNRQLLIHSLWPISETSQLESSFCGNRPSLALIIPSSRHFSPRPHSSNHKTYRPDLFSSAFCRFRCLSCHLSFDFILTIVVIFTYLPSIQPILVSDFYLARV